MDSLRSLFFYIALMLVPSYSLAANADYMRISFIEGDVQMRTLEAADWGPSSLNNPVLEGDEFWLPQNSRLEIQLNSGTYIRLDQESSIQMLSKEKNSVQFYLSKGHAYIVHDAPEGSVTQVDTQDASTRVFVSSFFRVDLMDKFTEVGVYTNYVETENKAGSVRVNAGEMVSLGLQTNGEVAPMGGQDEWEKWNIARNHGYRSNDEDVASTKTEMHNNLPEELKTYSDELDNSGKWTDVPEYGNVWTPTVEADWAPYKDGRWVWRDDDYVWVASEPWGWAPYHYGRWAFVAGIGWCWVPPAARDVYWSPGYVGWVTSGDYVAWVPLAPGETYYGRGYFGTHSINIRNTNISQVNTTNIYKNVNINNSVTVIRRDTFATASPKIVKLDQATIRQKIFTKNISVGTPAIKPTPASYFASAKKVPTAERPPQSVRDLNIKELKQSRPLIREQMKSVLSPGVEARPLPVSKVSVPRTPGKPNPVTNLMRPQEGQNQRPNQRSGEPSKQQTGEDAGAHHGIGRTKPDISRNDSKTAQPVGAEEGVGRSKPGRHRTEYVDQSREEKVNSRTGSAARTGSVARTGSASSRQDTNVGHDRTSTSSMRSEEKISRNVLGIERSDKMPAGARKQESRTVSQDSSTVRGDSASTTTVKSNKAEPRNVTGNRKTVKSNETEPRNATGNRQSDKTQMGSKKAGSDAAPPKRQSPQINKTEPDKKRVPKPQSDKTSADTKN